LKDQDTKIIRDKELLKKAKETRKPCTVHPALIPETLMEELAKLKQRP
jgi:hypothetical protein